MPYTTPLAILEYLDQLEGTNEEQVQLQRIAERATSIIDTALGGIAFGAWPATATSAAVLSYGGAYLSLPAHKPASVTAVALGTATVPFGVWTETPRGNLILTSGLLGGWYNRRGWAAGVYTITAIWGYGPPPPAIEQLALEIAVNIWRAKDKGMFQETLGAADGANIRYVGGLNSTQMAILNGVRDAYREVTV